jgi:hypothetical protein
MNHFTLYWIAGGIFIAGLAVAIAQGAQSFETASPLVKMLAILFCIAFFGGAIIQVWYGIIKKK